MVGVHELTKNPANLGGDLLGSFICVTANPMRNLVRAGALWRLTTKTTLMEERLDSAM